MSNKIISFDAQISKLVHSVTILSKIINFDAFITRSQKADTILSRTIFLEVHNG